MKNLPIFLILTYLFFTINSHAINQNVSENNLEDEKILKVGVLLPLSGQFKDLGNSFLKAIQLALYDTSNKNIKIYPKDSGGNALDSYQSAKEFKEMGIKIVIGPVFFESLDKLSEINDITFISLTNKTRKIPKNIIAFGININSQINTIKDYLKKKDINKTLLLSPKDQFVNQTEVVKNSKIKFDKIYLYDTNPKKITSEVAKITRYEERKKDLERRIKILEKSDLYKDQQELKKLEQKHTLGKISFDSVMIIDFGERLKSVLTSFMFADISNKEVTFFSINQWFDKTFFNENALENLHFPSINLKKLTKYNKKYLDTFGENSHDISILAYDALGLIYYCWSNNDYRFEADTLYNKKGFEGLHGEFVIENNLSKHKLEIYKVSEKKFIKVH